MSDHSAEVSPTRGGRHTSKSAKAGRGGIVNEIEVQVIPEHNLSLMEGSRDRNRNDSKLDVKDGPPTGLRSPTKITKVAS
jgi:hypothetical protein